MQLTVLCLAVLGGLSADEARFDPLLDGACLGIEVDFNEGRPQSPAGMPIVKRVDAGSPARLAGLARGDILLRLDSTLAGETFEDFQAAVRRLHPGKPALVEVLRGTTYWVLQVIPDPESFRDYYRMVEVLRHSRFFRGRDGFADAIGALEAEVPPLLRNARRASEVNEILNRSLLRLGASHTALIPSWTYQHLLQNERTGLGGIWTGVFLEKFRPERGAAGGGEVERFFAAEVFDGGPAAIAKVLVGDEVLSVNGIPIGRSPRLILGGYEANRERYTIQVEQDESVDLEVRRQAQGPGTLTLRLKVDELLSGLTATTASIRWIEREGRTVAAIHFWNFLAGIAPEILDGLLDEDDSYAEGLIVDLRGRGGQVAVVNRIADLLGWADRPAVLLTDRETRSAKEILARKMKGSPHVTLVGERTAGAVLPAGSELLPSWNVLMLPADRPTGWIARLLEGRDDNLLWGELEGRGVEPDFPVARPGPYSAGVDPIFERGLTEVLGMLRTVPRRARL